MNILQKQVKRLNNKVAKDILDDSLVRVLKKEQPDVVKLIRSEVIKDIDKIFSEGFYNYFHTTYGTDNEDLNRKMILDIDKKVKELKRHLSTFSNKKKGYNYR